MTDYDRIRALFDDCFEVGYRLGREGAGESYARTQKALTVSAKVNELCELLGIGKAVGSDLA